MTAADSFLCERPKFSPKGENASKIQDAARILQLFFAFCYEFRVSARTLLARATPLFHSLRLPFALNQFLLASPAGFIRLRASVD